MRQAAVILLSDDDICELMPKQEQCILQSLMDVNLLEWSLIHIGISFDRLHQIEDARRALIDQTYQPGHHHCLSEPGQHIVECTRAYPRSEGLQLHGVQLC